MATATLKKEDIITAIENMTVLELNDLVKELEGKFGVSAAAPMMAAMPVAGAAEAAPEEKDEFDVVLTGIGDKKIQVIKVVRELTSLGLKEAKEVVDNPGKAVKEKVSKEEAAQMKAKLEEAGATVEIK
ncbi:MAG: 50S ribosomal protein L7/L12 [Candidatus Glassbacteria bacterium]